MTWSKLKPRDYEGEYVIDNNVIFRSPMIPCSGYTGMRGRVAYNGRNGWGNGLKGEDRRQLTIDRLCSLIGAQLNRVPRWRVQLWS